MAYLYQSIPRSNYGDDTATASARRNARTDGDRTPRAKAKAKARKHRRIAALVKATLDVRRTALPTGKRGY